MMAAASGLPVAGNEAETDVRAQEGCRLTDGPEAAGGECPAWWRARREAAWAEFRALPMPTRRDEDWRFANLSGLALEGFEAGRAVSRGDRARILEASCVPFEAAAVAVFANDAVVAAPELPAEWRRAGVKWLALEEAVRSEEALVREHFLAHPVDLGSAKFAALHAAFAGAGTVLFVPKGVRLDRPLVAFHWLAGEGAAAFPHTLVVAGEESACALVDVYASAGETGGFGCAMTDLHAGRGSSVTHCAVQRWSERATGFGMRSTAVGREASVKTLTTDFGCAFLRDENRSRLLGPGARSEMLALGLAHGRQEFDKRTLQDHLAPHAWSDLLYKNALNHRAKAIFQGLIRVEPGAAQTDAYQTNRNLLLSGAAEADSLPGLEILNDDVKCSHGATTGQVDPEQMFYMQTRGIREPQAKHLLVVGFIEEVLERLGDAGIGAYVHGLVEEKFARSETLQEAEAEPPRAETGAGPGT